MRSEGRELLTRAVLAVDQHRVWYLESMRPRPFTPGMRCRSGEQLAHIPVAVAVAVAVLVAVAVPVAACVAVTVAACVAVDVATGLPVAVAVAS